MYFTERVIYLSRDAYGLEGVSDKPAKFNSDGGYSLNQPRGTNFKDEDPDGFFGKIISTHKGFGKNWKYLITVRSENDKNRRNTRRDNEQP